MTRAFKLKSTDHLGSPARKRAYNEKLFTEVAPVYDSITRVLSLGRDAAWKRHLVAALPDWEAPVCVDLACGTGDVSYLLARKYPRGTVLGMDLTERMLRIARDRHPPGNLRFRRGDMGQTGMTSGTVDVVTGSYALRNAADLDQVLDEVSRILKPGGVAAFLDFSRPSARWLASAEYLMLKAWGSLWGLLVHGNSDVYAYIAESLARFPNRTALRRCFQQRQFTLVRSRRFYFGVLELLVAEHRAACRPRLTSVCHDAWDGIASGSVTR